MLSWLSGSLQFCFWSYLLHMIMSKILKVLDSWCNCHRLMCYTKRQFCLNHCSKLDKISGNNFHHKCINKICIKCCILPVLQPTLHYSYFILHSFHCLIANHCVIIKESYFSTANDSQSFKKHTFHVTKPHLMVQDVDGNSQKVESYNSKRSWSFPVFNEAYYSQ